MARNGAGTYVLPAGNPVVTATTIDSSWANGTMPDIGSELTNSIPRDGQAPPTANLPMGGFRHTGAQNPVGAQDYVTLGYLTSTSLLSIGVVPLTSSNPMKINNYQPVLKLGQYGGALAMPNDLVENIALQVSVPAGSMSIYGRVEINFVFTGLAGNSTFTVRKKFAGTTYSTTVTPAAATTDAHNGNITNASSAILQTCLAGYHPTSTTYTEAASSLAIDTNAAATFSVTVQKSIAGDTITLVSYCVKLIS